MFAHRSTSGTGSTSSWKTKLFTKSHSRSKSTGVLPAANTAGSSNADSNAKNAESSTNSASPNRASSAESGPSLGSKTYTRLKGSFDGWREKQRNVSELRRSEHLGMKLPRDVYADLNLVGVVVGVAPADSTDAADAFPGTSVAVMPVLPSAPASIWAIMCRLCRLSRPLRSRVCAVRVLLLLLTCTVLTPLNNNEEKKRKRMDSTAPRRCRCRGQGRGRMHIGTPRARREKMR